MNERALIKKPDADAGTDASMEKPSPFRRSRSLIAFSAPVLVRLLSVLSFIGVWAIAAYFVDQPNFLPSPAAVFEKLGDLIRNEDFFFHAWWTVRRVFIGFTLSMVFGAAIGVAMGLWRSSEHFLDVYILIGLTIPGLAWALLSVMWFGVSETAPVFAIVMVTTPMLAVNTWQGTKAIDKYLLEMAKVFRVSRHRILTGVIIPQLMPYLFAASRFGFGLGWKVVVLSEIFGLTNGIGYMLNRGFSRFSMTEVLAWTIGFTFIMFAFEYGILQPIERRVLRWRPKLEF